MAAPDIILVTGKGYLSRFDQRRQDWSQVISVDGDPENGTPVRLLILQNDGFSLRAVHDRNGSVVLACNFSDTIVSGQSATVLHMTLKDGNKYCMQFMHGDEGAQFQMILKSAFEESRRNTAGKPYSSGTKLGGAGAMAAAASATLPPAKAMEPPRSPLAGATSGETVVALIEALKKALAAGDVASAKEVAGNLAQLKVKTNMMVESVGDIPPGRPGTIRLNVNIEDRVASGGKVILTVRPNETIATLKRKMFTEYKFPVQVQRWIMGRRIPKDFETLLENGIGISGANAYLYLVSAEKVGVTKRQAELERQPLNHQAPQNPPGLDRPIPAPVYPPHMNQQTYLQPQPNTYQPPPPNLYQQASYSSTLSPPTSQRRRVPSGGDSGGYMRMDTNPRRPQPAPTPPKVPAKPTAEQVGWHCPACTLINPPTFPGCRVCSQERPADYQVPREGSYIMDPDERRRYDDVRRNEQLMQQVDLDLEPQLHDLDLQVPQPLLSAHDLGAPVRRVMVPYPDSDEDNVIVNDV